MKVKNLLLAGLAVAAMTACSNDVDEIVDNGNQNPGTALMQLSFEFPNTRATEVEDKDGDKGTSDEYNVKTVDIQLTYQDGTTATIQKLISDFNIESEGQILTLKSVETVNAGTVTKAAAVLNKGAVTLWGVEPYETTASGLDFLSNSIAKATEFLMSGEKTGEMVFTKGNTTQIIIPVSRVSAKLDEVTDTKIFTIAKNDDTNAQINEEMTITLEDYSYGNLTLKSYILPGDVTQQKYFQPYQTTKDDYVYNKMSNDAVVYCLENAATNDFTGNSTYVLYKAKVAFGGIPKTDNFYVWNNTVYKSITELKAVYTALGEGFTDDTTQKEFLTKNVYKYENGECFYMTAVDHETNLHKIVRNTWYKLDVTSISKLGFPTPEVPPTFDKNAYMDLKITITPWTVKFNKIEF